MSAYASYVEEVSSREKEGLDPKPIEAADLTAEIIAQIKDTGHQHREDSLKYFIYNTCLLYTSPSPRDATLSRMPSSA